MNRDELIQIILSHGQMSEGALADAILSALPRWIPVTERLPSETESMYVLVACSTGSVKATFFVPDPQYFKRRMERTWNTHELSGHFECGAEYGYVITHWMPLPAAPEQEPK